jgi:small subunit ribosomal protein S8
MSVTDPIADMLTCIRNAGQAKHKKVEFPASRVKEEITRLLLREKYIASYRRTEDGKQGILRIYLKYDENAAPVIQYLQRVSRPGRRQYVPRDKVPRVRSGLGTAILTTPKGVMTDREARAAGIGGEVLAELW